MSIIFSEAVVVQATYNPDILRKKMFPNQVTEHKMTEESVNLVPKRLLKLMWMSVTWSCADLAVRVTAHATPPRTCPLK